MMGPVLPPLLLCVGVTVCGFGLYKEREAMMWDEGGYIAITSQTRSPSTETSLRIGSRCEEGPTTRFVLRETNCIESIVALLRSSGEWYSDCQRPMLTLPRLVGGLLLQLKLHIGRAIE
jgi:hypothetical protein